MSFILILKYILAALLALLPFLVRKRTAEVNGDGADKQPHHGSLVTFLSHFLPRVWNLILALRNFASRLSRGMRRSDNSRKFYTVLLLIVLLAYTYVDFSATEVVRDIIRFTIDTLGEHLDILGPKYAGVVRGARQAFGHGKDVILRGAPYVMVFASDHSFGAADCNLAYQNASLMAQSLGVSQFYMGFVMTATALADPERVKELFGVSQKVQALMAFGMPRLRYKRYAERG